MPLSPAPESRTSRASPAHPDIEIHRADPGEAKRSFWVALVSLALGIGVALLMQRELSSIRGWLQAGETEFATQQFLILARVALGSLALLGVIAGIWVGRASFAVLQEQRYPHTSARLLRDRRIRRGTDAQRIGYAGLALAAGFIVVAVAGSIFGWTQLATF